MHLIIELLTLAGVVVLLVLVLRLSRPASSVERATGLNLSHGPITEQEKTT